MPSGREINKDAVDHARVFTGSIFINKGEQTIELADNILVEVGSKTPVYEEVKSDDFHSTYYAAMLVLTGLGEENVFMLPTKINGSEIKLFISAGMDEQGYPRSFASEAIARSIVSNINDQMEKSAELRNHIGLE